MPCLFQKVLCIGDSQTFGARSSAGYPEYLSDVLWNRCKKQVDWICVNAGVNGETVLEIMRRADRELRLFEDIFVVCVLAGTNDWRMDVQTDPELFEMLYRQLLIHVLRSPTPMKGKFVFPATLPIPMSGYCTFPHDRKSEEQTHEANIIIRRVVEDVGLRENLVELEDLKSKFFVDAVHFSDEGCIEVAKCFADRIIERTP